MGRTGLRRVVLVVASGLLLALGVFAPVPQAHALGIRYRDTVFTSYTVTPGIVYGRSRDGAGVLHQHELDVLQPAGDTARTRAAVIWVHGGSFKGGARDDAGYRLAREAFVKAGYVTFSIDYTLEPSLPDPPGGILAKPDGYLAAAVEGQHDAQAAVRWVRAHARQYRLDPRRIAIAGHSAGAVIAQMVGFNEHDPGTSGNPGWSSHVDAIVSGAGLTVPGLMVQVDIGEPPLLDTHGLADTTVPFGPGLTTCAATLALGNVCEQVIDPDQTHATFGYQQWRTFLYRRLIAPLATEVHTDVEIVGAESLLASAH